MSQRQNNEDIKKIEKDIKICQLNDDVLISYNIEMLEKMKLGYEQMGEINLKYANESVPDFKDGVYYEKWLCGV